MTQSSGAQLALQSVREQPTAAGVQSEITTSAYSGTSYHTHTCRMDDAELSAEVCLQIFAVLCVLEIPSGSCQPENKKIRYNIQSPPPKAPSSLLNLT